jgi:hypothetical protein
VSHWWKGGPKKGHANVVVFKSNGGHLSFHDWIELDRPRSPDGRKEMAEFQAIHPRNGMFYTCFGGGTINEFFVHNSQGNFTNETLKLDPPVSRVQGACFSPNGHLYIATNEPLPGNLDYQTIWYYSALNGHRLGVIPVLAEDGLSEDYESPDQELEGICFANIGFGDGRKAQIHAVLLENRPAALDNIFFKSFSSTKSDIV